MTYPEPGTTYVPAPDAAGEVAFMRLPGGGAVEIHVRVTTGGFCGEIIGAWVWAVGTTKEEVYRKLREFLGITESPPRVSYTQVNP